MILESALLCLSLNIFYEARNQSIPGQYAVAQVVMNRAKQDQRKVCSEVYKPKQFSWTHQVAAKTKRPWQIDPDSWDRAQKIARVVLSGKTVMDFTKGATYYHATSIRPSWAYKRGMMKTKHIGSHIFYRQDKS